MLFNYICFMVDGKINIERQEYRTYHPLSIASFYYTSDDCNTKLSNITYTYFNIIKDLDVL